MAIPTMKWDEWWKWKLVCSQKERNGMDFKKWNNGKEIFKESETGDIERTAMEWEKPS